MSQDEYLERFRRDVLPRIAGSVASIAIIADEPDPKVCLEIGASILLDKPIIVVATPGQNIPKVLARIASAVLVGDISEPGFQSRLTAALREVLKKPTVL